MKQTVYYTKFPVFDLSIIIAKNMIAGVEFLQKDPRLIQSVISDDLVNLTFSQLNNYLQDGSFEFSLPLMLTAVSSHCLTVLAEMSKIAPGKTTSYGDIAQTISSSALAVGSACGVNPIALIIPCHRVIAKSGKLGGFMGGKDKNHLLIKRWLLEHEGANYIDDEHIHY